MAAVLATGGVLGHRSAAGLWGLRPDQSSRVHVTVPRRVGRARPGLVVHTTRYLPAEELTTCEGILCTSVARTLIDLAGVLNERQLRRALEQALVLRIFDRRALDAALARAGGRGGTGMLRSLLTDLVDEPPLLRSELERRVWDLIVDNRLKRPVANGFVEGYEVDFHWADERLIIEVDGRAAHDHALAFTADRRRDFDLARAGWEVVRLTWHQVVVDPEPLVAWLRWRLGEGAARARPSGRAARPRRPARQPQ
jgi:very-short-patch-repair endonuclease